MPVSIRFLADTDLESATVVLASAFQSSGNWANELRLYRGMQSNGCFGAYQDGNLVGMVGATIYSAYAYVGLMGVHQQYQRQGIGLALMKHLLAWLEDQNVSLILLDASPAGQPLYEKLGFIAYDDVHVFQRKNGQPICQPPPEIRFLSPQDLDLIAVADTQAFGADRSRVLQALLETYPKRAFILQGEQGQIHGYLFSQENRIGPWIMKGSAGAESLLRAALSLPFGEAASVVVPGGNMDAIALLQNYGFSTVRVNRHMARGLGMPVGQRNKVFGQASLSLG